jgi:hypothetical protein
VGGNEEERGGRVVEGGWVRDGEGALINGEVVEGVQVEARADGGAVCGAQGPVDGDVGAEGVQDRDVLDSENNGEDVGYVVRAICAREDNVQLESVLGEAGSFGRGFFLRGYESCRRSGHDKRELHCENEWTGSQVKKGADGDMRLSKQTNLPTRW